MFRVVGACPNCGRPIFGHATMLNQQVPSVALASCFCVPDDLVIEIPEREDLAQERQAILLLHGMMMQYLQTAAQAERVFPLIEAALIKALRTTGGAIELAREEIEESPQTRPLVAFEQVDGGVRIWLKERASDGGGS